MEFETRYDEEGNPLSKEDSFRQSQEFIDLVEEVKKIQPMRIGVFKRYWDKFKYNKSRREYLIDLMDENDEQVKYYLADEFRGWRDEIEGVHTFLEELAKKQVDNDIRKQLKGNTLIRTIKGKHDNDTLQEIEYSSKTFNPYDPLNIKMQQK